MAATINVAINTAGETKREADVLPFLDAPLNQVPISPFGEYSYTSVRTADVTVPPHYQGGMVQFTNVSMIHPYTLGDNVLNTALSIHCPTGAFTLPQNMQEYLKTLGIPSEKIHLHIAAQNMSWEATSSSPVSSRPLFRPHYAYHTSASPDDEQSIKDKKYNKEGNLFIGIFSRTDPVELEGIPRNILSKRPIPFRSHSERSTGMVVSSYAAPQNPPINGINPRVSSSFFSVCLTEDKERCDVTLHLLLNDSDFSCINEINKGEALLTLKSLIIKLCQFKAAGKLDLSLFNILELFIHSPDIRQCLLSEFTHYLERMHQGQKLSAEASTRKVQALQNEIEKLVKERSSNAARTKTSDQIDALKLILDNFSEQILKPETHYQSKMSNIKIAFSKNLKNSGNLSFHNCISIFWKTVGQLNLSKEFYDYDNELGSLLAINISEIPANQLIDVFHKRAGLLIEKIKHLTTLFQQHLAYIKNKINAPLQSINLTAQQLKQFESYNRRLETIINHLRKNQTQVISVEGMLEQNSQLRSTIYELAWLLHRLSPLSEQFDALSHPARIKKISTQQIDVSSGTAQTNEQIQLNKTTPAPVIFSPTNATAEASVTLNQAPVIEGPK